MVDSPDDSTVSCFAADLPEGAPALLLKLRLLSAEGDLLSENFYMIPEERSGSLKALRGLRAAKLGKMVKVSGSDVSVTVRNNDSVPALLVRLVLKDHNGEEILPAGYSDNYFALLPGEEKTVHIACRSARQSSAQQSLALQSPAHQSPARQSPARQSPIHQSPVHQSPAHQSPAHQSPIHQSPALDIQQLGDFAL